MPIYQLQIKLLSDTTFGRGDGLPGSIDREIEHDRYGLPYLRGRSLKGLLSEEVDNLLYNLSRIEGTSKPPQAWIDARNRLFGRSSGYITESAAIHYGDATYSENIRQTVMEAIRDDRVTRQDVLDALTAIRRQTAIETVGESYGVPVDYSLRSMRVLLRETVLTARLSTPVTLSDREEGLLSAGVMALRRGGTGRNRGRGWLKCDLLVGNQSILETRFDTFVRLAQLEPQEVSS